MNVCGSRTLALAMAFSVEFFVLLPCENICAQDQPAPAAGMEVFVYGNEQALVDSMTKGREDQAPKHFTNSLDHAFAVLLARAHPPPEPGKLADQTVASLCEDLERRKPNRFPLERRKAWVATVLRTRSFESVLRDVEESDPDGPNRRELVAAGLKGMLAATGWSSACVLSGVQAEELRKMVEARKTPRKERGILGLKITHWPTVEVVPHMPAAEAGLRNGDVVLRVNGRDVTDIRTTADTLKALRGAAGTKISLTVKRGNETLTLEVRRAPYATARIRASVVSPGVVYIQIPLFEGSGIAGKVNELIREHVTDATSDVILDLRDNPGGRPKEVNAVADIFLDDKCLQIYQFRNGKRISFKSKPGALDVRVIVLTNHNTGSGAEVLALALHDNHRGTIIGESTAGALFGKDFEKLENGQMIIFRSQPTILSPKGNDYSGTGLPPDIVVSESRTSGKDEILRRAIQFAKSQMGRKTPKSAGDE